MPFDFQHKTAGKLVMFTDQKGLVAARKQVAFQAQYGSQQEVIDATGVIGDQDRWPGWEWGLVEHNEVMECRTIAPIDPPEPTVNAV